MPAHHRTLMARFTQGHDGVVIALFDVVGVRGAGLATDGARLLLDQVHPVPLDRGQLTVHITARSMTRLDASVERQQSILACAETKPHRRVSSASTAACRPFRTST